MAHTRRDVHPTFGYIAVNLVELGEHLGSPPIRPTELIRELKKLGMHCHEYDLVHTARQCIGMRYRRDALASARPRTFDCSTLMQFVFAHAGVWLPRFTHLMVEHGDVVAPPYQPGDLLFTTGRAAWRHPHYPHGIGHMAMVTSPNRCVHTDNTKSKRVIEISIADLQWPIVVAKRLLPNVQTCSVAQLPSNLLWVHHPEELEALMRKHLQANRRPSSS